ncbi:MAG: SDR family oxidoreductase [Pseudomonadota bacterium]
MTDPAPHPAVPSLPQPMNARLSALFGLHGKVALVTGSSGGLGAHFAATLAEAGAHVFLAGRRVAKLREVAGAIAAQGGSADPLEMDVTRKDSIEAAIAAVEAKTGHLDILVNNSGVAVTASAASMAERDWDKVIDTNLKGAWSVSRAALPLLETSCGTIINIASILGLSVLKGLSAYAVSKAGLIQLTRAMALELARVGVRVNAIAPGYIKTDINRAFFESDAGAQLIKGIPMRRLADAGELDGALLLLSSGAGSFMTGTTVVVDGGHTLALS